MFSAAISGSTLSGKEKATSSPSFTRQLAFTAFPFTKHFSPAIIFWI
jgi:hypothetical protein